MGQEASIPSVDDDLDEQARAPPSAVNPPPPPPLPSNNGSSKRKLMGGMLFHRGHHHNEEDDDASGENGNFYITSDGTTTDDYQKEQQQAAQYYSQQQQQTSQPYYSSSQQSISDAGLDGATEDQQQIVGVMYEKQPPTKKGIGGRAGARGAALIHSMRNLSLGGSLRGGKQQQKEQVHDWEKQWDEDDEEDEEEEDDEYSEANKVILGPTHPPTTGTIPSLLQPVRPGMDAGYSSSTLIQDSSQQHLAPPLTTVGPMATPVPPASSLVGQRQEQLIAEQLRSSQQQQPVVPSGHLVSVDEDGMMDWGTGAVHAPPEEDVSLKPNIDMFLPMLRVLGKGSFGKVVLVQKRVGKERGQLFAMKILQKTHLVKRRQIERTRTERKVLSIVNHPFIMKLHYAFQSADKLYLVLDYCPGGELFFHLSRFRRFPERVARFYAAELLLAIGHLHKRGIIYRDLKPENVLLDADGHVKLGDFGLAKAGIKHPFEGAHSMCGTPEYMAPEVLAQTGHGFCVDYWGLGMLVYEMMTGLPPWYTTDRTKLFKRLKNAPLDIPSYFSVQSANCVSALLERNPKRRLGVTGIRTAMEHEFFRNISWRALYSRRVEAPVRPCEGWKPPEGVQEPEDLLDDMGNGSPYNTASMTDIEKLDSRELDAATANFDNTFTRMPVESEDSGQHQQDNMQLEEGEEELRADTFVGFTFDGKDDGESATKAARTRTQHFANGPN